jgi:hypothetical protein
LARSARAGRRRARPPSRVTRSAMQVRRSQERSAPRRTPGHRAHRRRATASPERTHSPWYRRPDADTNRSSLIAPNSCVVLVLVAAGLRDLDHGRQWLRWAGRVAFLQDLVHAAMLPRYPQQTRADRDNEGVRRWGLTTIRPRNRLFELVTRGS